MKSKWLPTFPLHAANWLADPRVQMLRPVQKSELLEALLRSWMLGKSVAVHPQIAEAYAELWPEYEAVLREHNALREKRAESGKRGNASRWGSQVRSQNASQRESQGESQTAEHQTDLVRRTPTPTPTDVSPSEIHRRPRKRAARDGERLPDDFALTAQRRQVALRCGVAVDRVDAMFREFTNYWRAKPGRDALKLDWDATWENRCITLAERGTSVAGYQRPPTVDERNRAAAASVKAKYALPEVQQ